MNEGLGIVTLRAVLMGVQEYAGWLYLPAPPWSLDTAGRFVEHDKDADPADGPPAFVVENGWSETLDAAGIEDIVWNAREQLEEASAEDLFEAFVFYMENDAFIDFRDEFDAHG